MTSRFGSLHRRDHDLGRPLVLLPVATTRRPIARNTSPSPIQCFVNLLKGPSDSLYIFRSLMDIDNVYLRQGGYVFVVVCLFVCLFSVC